MSLMQAILVALLYYLALVLGILLTPLIILLGLWVGLALISGFFMVLFFFITHRVHDLYMGLYMLAWGFPPILFCCLLGYFGDRIRTHARSRRQAALLPVPGDAPFC